MKTKKYISYIGICAISILSIAYAFSLQPQKQDTIPPRGEYVLEVITDRSVSARDQLIYLKQSPDNAVARLHLLLSSTYGSILLSLKTEANHKYFVIPKAFTKRAGVVSYTFLKDETVIQQGTFRLLPNTSSLGSLTTYLGPRSIIANKRDYTMLVSIPTDTLDNILPDSTAIAIKSHFKETVVTTQHSLTSGIAWRRITAPLQTGRLSTTSILENKSSIELVADVFPDIAKDFTIRSEKNHSYADGNEIITFKTSQIKDAHANIMTDGTLITFYIKSDLGDFWQTQASTVNGYAFAKMLHPEAPSTWRITATIKGIAQSKEIRQVFKPIINDLSITVSRNQTIIVAPITSHLGQIIPDGILVSLEYQGKSIEKFTKKGEVTFDLSCLNLGKNQKCLVIKALGMTKTIQL